MLLSLNLDNQKNLLIGLGAVCVYFITLLLILILSDETLYHNLYDAHHF